MAQVSTKIFLLKFRGWNNETLSNKWVKLYKIKQEANIAIEAKRASKEIGSSLELKLN